MLGFLRSLKQCVEEGEGGIDERASTSWPAGRVSQLGPQQTQAVVPLGNQITRNDTKHTPGIAGWDQRAEAREWWAGTGARGCFWVSDMQERP